MRATDGRSTQGTSRRPESLLSLLDRAAGPAAPGCVLARDRSEKHHHPRKNKVRQAPFHLITDPPRRRDEPKWALREEGGVHEADMAEPEGAEPTAEEYNAFFDAIMAMP